MAEFSFVSLVPSFCVSSVPSGFVSSLTFGEFKLPFVSGVSCVFSDALFSMLPPTVILRKKKRINQQNQRGQVKLAISDQTVLIVTNQRGQVKVVISDQTVSIVTNQRGQVKLVISDQTVK
jgi:hypothetical protein